MSGRGSDEEDLPACETGETDNEAQERQSPSPPGPAVPFYQGLVYELLLGEPGRQEAGRVEDGQEAGRVEDGQEAGRGEDGHEAEPLEEEREEPPAPEDPQDPKAPPDLEGPQNPADPPAPEDPQSPDVVEYELQVMEEAEDRNLVHGGGSSGSRARTGI